MEGLSGKFRTWTPLVAKVVWMGGEGGRCGGGISSSKSFAGVGVLDILQEVTSTVM